ncbi:MAG: hypothetical protein HN403_11040 [Rhodospirillales bacterium]|nr:hypothetical protein [Rhodospirillales bacterium]
MPRLGIITGLASEARCLTGWPGDCQLNIACSGADSARATEIAREMAASGCDGLVSFGLAGGLDPGLRCGDLVLPESVIYSDTVWPVDAEWRKRLLGQLSPKIRAVGGAIAGSSALVTSPEEKAALRKDTGAMAVDMESHAIAGANLPFIAVRVIADPYDKAVPDWGAGVIGTDGAVMPTAAAKAIFKNLGSFTRLLGVAVENRQAISVLRRVAMLVRGDFGFG